MLLIPVWFVAALGYGKAVAPYTHIGFFSITVNIHHVILVKDKSYQRTNKQDRIFMLYKSNWKQLWGPLPYPSWQSTKAFAVSSSGRCNSSWGPSRGSKDIRVPRTQQNNVHHLHCSFCKWRKALQEAVAKWWAKEMYYFWKRPDGGLEHQRKTKGFKSHFQVSTSTCPSCAAAFT